MCQNCVKIKIFILICCLHIIPKDQQSKNIYRFGLINSMMKNDVDITKYLKLMLFMNCTENTNHEDNLKKSLLRCLNEKNCNNCTLKQEE